MQAAMIKPAPINMVIDTPFLRASYARDNFSFGNPNAETVICLAGSCRMLPYLNFLRTFNHFSGNQFELLCFNPIEMWTPGEEVIDCINNRLADYRFNRVDWLLCEYMVGCGVLNTIPNAKENIFDNMGCHPENEPLRLPNWNGMFIYDADMVSINQEYAALPHDERVPKMRGHMEKNKDRFLGYCRSGNLLGLDRWVEDNWLTTRIGLTNNHVSLEFSLKVFDMITEIMNLEITSEMRASPHFSKDRNSAHSTVLNAVDYEANHWRF